jgi:hypothetical protein
VVGLFQSFQDQFTFGFRGCYSKRQHDFRRRFRPRMTQVRRQMKCLDPFALGKDQSSFLYYDPSC